ncbi:MAG: hypothetical protein AAF567_24455 [Actinomycetota bacterium]
MEAEHHLDQWAPLNQWLTEPRSLGDGQWIPRADQRRLAAYHLLRAVETNNLKDMLEPDEDGNPPALAEWGEASMFVSRVIAGLLSRSLTFIVDGAEQPPPPIAPIPDPIPEPDRTDQAAVDAYEAAVELRTEAANEAIEKWRERHAAYKTAVAWQTWWDDWAVKEQYLAKLGENERSYVGPLGDGVLVHGWDPELGRPYVNIIDPGEYFPVLDAHKPRWPARVYRAWEHNHEKPDGTIEERLYRVRWDTIDLDGPQRLPWNTESTTKTVRLTEHWWDRGDAGDWHGLDENEATEVRAVDDMGIDFVPVVHIPNTPETVNHYGQSLLALYVGLFAAIARQNANIVDAAELAATPAFTSNGVDVPNVNLGPGAVLNVQDGELDPLELGPALEPLLKVGDWLMDRFATNTQVGKAILGITTGESGSSGIKLRLQFGPFEQLIEWMRPSRAEKYALSAKMIMRLAQYGGEDVPEGPPPKMRVEFGSITPADLQSVIEDINKLGDVISPATKLAVLKAAGWPIGDIEEELRRAEMANFENAALIVEATGNTEAAARYLGIQGDAASDQGS